MFTSLFYAFFFYRKGGPEGPSVFIKKERRKYEVLLLKDQKKIRKREGKGRGKEKVQESPIPK